ncbi:periplasmic heavy metal sensor [Corallococcus praedator]|uniref:Periplasmic heavy metal sensor n=1 Tax=Corallococcus praedator TaxID=2316724 RepID=A0ABX9QME2_9BACT|nr:MULTISPECIES: periplasmic heavy metal sensor [Corallococcus]RKH32814.1 periplasmic heavy metal sensor [Corallococcus sp. CA031C]RKI13471.1 periplasmic heavy metal sensor [Corallococcus praedator]
MKKKLIIAGTAVVAVTLLTGFGFGGRGGHHGSPDPERIKQMVTWKLDDKLDDLDATEAQRSSIHAVKDRLLAEGQQLMEGQQAVRTEALAQLESPTPDAAKLHALVDSRIDAFRAFAHKATDAVLEMHRTLTPAQRQELASEYRERTGQK